ncbi:MAG: T9SS type A sorting domain-containing protein [Bacteroidetes bacterium]|jgi:hypothetical protein|nr:T9SS type A sorting domain-containing protein [Bacteroidota bacterium]
MKYVAFFCLLIASLLGSYAQNLSANSTGSIVFSPSDPLSNQPIEVFYHIPDGDISSMPIVFSFHGANRDANNYRDDWINMAKANNFMVFAPEFTSQNYPGLGDNYLMGNIFDDGDNPNSIGLKHSAVVDNQQDLQRMERGQYFLNTSQIDDQNQSVTFNWENYEFLNISHDALLMANDTLPYVMMTTLSSNAFRSKKSLNIYPNPLSNAILFKNLPQDISTINIYDIAEKLVALGLSVGVSEGLDISSLRNGMYI